MMRKMLGLAVLGTALGFAGTARAVDIAVTTAEELTNALATATANPDTTYTITLAARTYDLTSITPMCSNAPLNVENLTANWHSLTIQGDPSAGREEVVLDAKGASRIIRVAWKGGLTFKHLTFLNGNTLSSKAPGSAVYIDEYGDYTFRDCVFRGNAGYSNGALTSANHSHQAYWYDCLIESSYITCGWEGNLFSHPTVLSGCTFRANTNAADQSSAIVKLSSKSTVSDCTFENNVRSGRWPFTGGILHLSAGGTVTDCVFSNNVCTASSGAGLGLNNKVTVTRCQFFDNCSDSGTGAAMMGTTTTSQSVVTDCRFERNRAGSHGGAISGVCGLVTNCTFVGNSGECGGAVYNCTNIRVCVFRENRAKCATWLLDGGAGYESTFYDCIVTNNVGAYLTGAFESCRAYRCLVGENRVDNNHQGDHVVEAANSYFEECELYGLGVFGSGYKNCGFNRCVFRDNVRESGNGYFIEGSIAVTNCVFLRNRFYRFFNGPSANYPNAMLNCTLVSNKYDILVNSDGTPTVAIVNNLFEGNGTSTWSYDDDIGQGAAGTVYSNNYIRTSQLASETLAAAGNLDVYNDPSLKSRLRLAWQRDPAHPYAPRRLSVANGAGLVQGWMTNAVDSAGQPRLTNGKVAIGAYEPTLPLAGAAIVVR